MTKGRTVLECNPNESVWAFAYLYHYFVLHGKKERREKVWKFLHSLWSQTLKVGALSFPKRPLTSLTLIYSFPPNKLQVWMAREVRFLTSFWTAAMADLGSIYYSFVLSMAIYISASWLPCSTQTATCAKPKNSIIFSLREYTHKKNLLCILGLCRE